MTLEPGSTLGSQLRLVEPLSAGGLGTIWRAAHLGLGADVAVKVMSEQIKASPVAAIRFKEEARATAQIRHPNVLRVFDRGVTDDGDAYIVMELLVGESLRERLARGPLTVEETIHVVVQIAKGLEAAHRCQVVHRDLKPANVFLCEDDELPFVKILDFGIAKRLGDEALSMTSEGVLVGTLPYMSPEQLAAQPVDTRTDLWALGIVAYQCLVGHRPFDGENLRDLILAVEDGAFPPLSEHLANIPPAVDAWMTRALTPRMDRRFQSATEMLQAWRDAWGIPATKHSLRPPEVGLDKDSAAPLVVDSHHDTLPTETTAPTFTVVDPPRQEDAELLDVSGDRPSLAKRRRLGAVLLATFAGLAGALLITKSSGPAPEPPPSSRVAASPPSQDGHETSSAIDDSPVDPPEAPATAEPTVAPVPPGEEPPRARRRPPAAPATSVSAAPPAGPASAKTTQDKRTEAAGERLGI